MAAPSQQSLTTFDPRSLREIVADLERIDPSVGCRLLPVEQCQAVIDAGDAASRATTSAQATDMAQALVGVYRKDDVNDPQVYIRALAGLLASFPFAVSRKVAHPFEGLPGRLKFLPSIAEVREALEIEDRRQRNLVARAKWMLQERERRVADKRALTVGSDLKAKQVQEILDRVLNAKAVK